MNASPNPEHSAVRPNRRRFLQTASGIIAAATVVPRHVLGGAGQTAPSAKLNLGAVGVGGYAQTFLKGMADTGENITALCDLDHQYAGKVLEAYPQARRYRDFRELFAQEKDLDGVLVGVPDHSHAVVCLEAIRRRKHVLCMKPLTRTIYEERVVVKAAREAGIVTHVTANSNTNERALRLREMIEDGAVGDVTEVHCWVPHPCWPSGMVRPAGSDTVPKDFNWDLWIGPAPMRPFKDEYAEDSLAPLQIPFKSYFPYPRKVYHPFNFRGWWDFGTGAIGDWCCHFFNWVFPAFNLKHPAAVHASTTRLQTETAPLAAMVTYDFAAREGLPPLRLTWYDGGMKPPRPLELDSDVDLPREGTLVIGSRGKLLVGSMPQLLPLSHHKAYKLPPQKYPRDLRPPPAQWVQAIKTGEKPSCSFDWAGLITEVGLLGNVAIRTGERIEWDPANMRVTNVEKANEFIKPVYREGWKLEV